MSRPNTRQRSWDNYVGDKPIKSRKYTDFYKDSEMYNAGKTSSLGEAMDQMSEEDLEETQVRRKRQRRAPMSGYDQMRMMDSPPIAGMGGFVG
jgi:hypothetical protein